jgi:hypothetical protein
LDNNRRGKNSEKYLEKNPKKNPEKKEARLASFLSITPRRKVPMGISTPELLNLVAWTTARIVQDRRADT